MRRDSCATGLREASFTFSPRLFPPRFVYFYVFTSAAKVSPDVSWLFHQRGKSFKGFAPGLGDRRCEFGDQDTASNISCSPVLPCFLRLGPVVLFVSLPPSPRFHRVNVNVELKRWKTTKRSHVRGNLVTMEIYHRYVVRGQVTLRINVANRGRAIAR